ncbi:site-specific integrase [Aquimarina sp. 2201CG1-2-11]|uniref:tyrosine-type recombinase/integrase n=1 Tax=Aquimarina discodermiae TaxID=3231043 RepID=UPI003461FB77
MQSFINWGAAIQEPPITLIQDINFHVLQHYQMYILTELKNESKTHNNKIGVLSAFYSDCIKQDWISKENNPFDKIDELPTNYGTKNKPYTNEEIADMKEWILENDPYLWDIISFIYYSFLRPGELRDLKVGDIDLKENVIRVWVESSKGKRCDIVPIASGLRKIIDKMNLAEYDKDCYVFSGSKKPSTLQIGKNYMTKHFLKVKQHFGFDKDPDYTLYGFKHTAAVNWYKAEKDIRKIQKMCRHTTVTTTERYLKSLGLLEDENAVSMLPEI